MKNLICILLPLLLLLVSCGPKTAETTEQTDSLTVKFEADSAMAHIVAQCQFGPRTPGSEAHRQCGDWIVERFQSLGLEVEEQRAPLTMWDGKSFNCRNIIARYTPKDRKGDELPPIVIAAHWDSRPWADADPNESLHNEPVMAANDGASGIAVMLELARLLPAIGITRPVHFVGFDLEDYGKDDQEDSFAVGARYWSEQNSTTYDWGILLDMVGGRDAHFYYEGYSMRYASWLVARTWDAAARTGSGDIFVQRDGGYITDDHGPMNEIAGIPTIDIIPYYDQVGVPSFGPTWHTTHDTPENISTATLRAVGQALVQLLSE